MAIKTHSDIIRLWPNTSLFGRDVGVAPDTVRKMIARNSISSDHWGSVVAAAERRAIKTAAGESVTLALLQATSPKRRHGRM